jgi:prepilin-type N-terminal cleavage/methylation domain-containing protein
MKLKRRKNEEGFTLIELIMVIVILGIISAVAIPKFINLGESAKLSAARGVGSAVNATIQAKHSDWLINANTYTKGDVLSDTAFTGGCSYQSTDTDAPTIGEICVNTADDAFIANIKGDLFEWDWTAQSGDTPALLDEDSTSTFP